MWHALARRTRRVAVVAWVVLLVAFAPSQTWAAGDDASSTSDPAPTSPGSSESSSDQSSPGTGSPEISSSTAEPEPSSPSESSPVVVQLEDEQWQALMDQMSAEPVSPPSTDTGTLALDGSQWEELREWMTALGIGVGLVLTSTTVLAVGRFGRRD